MLVESHEGEIGQMSDVLVGGPNRLCIDELFVFVSQDPKTGKEGTAAFQQFGVWTPLVTGDKSNLDLMRAAARKIARMSGHKIVLLKFSQREELETIDG